MKKRNTSHGYIVLELPEHPHANSRGQVYEHVFIAARALGKALPKGAEVHHLNGDGADNRNENLVICQDKAYHRLLHRRMRALKATGNPNWKRCVYCKLWDSPAKMVVHSNGGRSMMHKSCNAAQVRNKRYANGTRVPGRKPFWRKRKGD